MNSIDSWSLVFRWRWFMQISWEWKKKTALTTNSQEQFTENKNWAKRNLILFDIGIPLDKVAIILRVCNRLNLRLSVKTKHVSNNPKFHGTTALKMSELFPALKFWLIFFCWASVGVQNWNGPIGFIHEIVRILDMTTIGAICGNFDIREIVTIQIVQNKSLYAR